MNKQEKILRFLQLMYTENYIAEQIQMLELSFALLGGALPSETAVVNEWKQNSTKMLEDLHQKYLPVYDRLYSEEYIDSLYEFYSSERVDSILKFKINLLLSCVLRKLLGKMKLQIEQNKRLLFQPLLTLIILS